jgi:hypothetical protein
MQNKVYKLQYLPEKQAATLIERPVCSNGDIHFLFSRSITGVKIKAQKQTATGAYIWYVD